MNMPDYLLPEGVKPQPGPAARWRLPLTAFALTLAAVAIGGLAAMFEPQAAENRATPATAVNAALTATAGNAQRAQRPGTPETTRSVKAWQDAIIGAQSAGLRCKGLYAGAGDAVSRGQLLARFDADMLLAGQPRLQASLAPSQAEAGELTPAQHLQVVVNDAGLPGDGDLVCRRI